ncbi:MAG: adenosylmethionine decarboxylase [Sulfuricella sp.]|jgi:S-adenosylmethionine/arginine decarboxylase-like enzyme
MKPIDSIDGLHLMGNLYGCGGEGQLLREINALRSFCLEQVGNCDLTAVGECFHQFGASGGVTGVVILAESHISVHTWPEKRFVTLDVFVCNMQCDNRAKAHQLFDALVAAFEPEEKRYYAVERF